MGEGTPSQRAQRDSLSHGATAFKQVIPRANMVFSTAKKHSIFRDIGAYALNPVLLNHFCSPLIFLSFPTCLNPVAHGERAGVRGDSPSSVCSLVPFLA
jgi:hypothetical protein